MNHCHSKNQKCNIILKHYYKKVILTTTTHSNTLWDTGWSKIKNTLASIWMKQDRLKAYTIDKKIPKY